MEDKRKWIEVYCSGGCSYYSYGKNDSFCDKYIKTLYHYNFKPLRCKKCIEEK